MIAIIDVRTPLSAKRRLGQICEVVELPPFSALDPRVASHPDMLVFLFEGKLFVCVEYYKEAKEAIDHIIAATSLELVLTDDRLGDRYPEDVAFNAFTLNGAIIGSTAHISKEIKAHANRLGYASASVKQGYAKCSTVVLEGAIITADNGIAKAAKGLGADTLLLSPGSVSLDGYDCGFIGGASGVYGNCVYFCGNIHTHPNGGRIIEFCKLHGYEVVSLSDQPLYDVGTIIFTQKG